METLFKESDFVTAHTALTQETAGKVESSATPWTNPAGNVKRYVFSSLQAAAPLWKACLEECQWTLSVFEVWLKCCCSIIKGALNWIFFSYGGCCNP